MSTQFEQQPLQFGSLPTNWKVVPLLHAVRDATGGRPKIQKGHYQAEGRFPVLDQGQSEIGGWTDDETLVSRFDGPVILFGDHTTKFQLVDRPFVLGADGVKVLEATDIVEPAFAFHYARTLHLPDVGYSRHFKFLKRKWIALPPLPEQRRIADILEKADAVRRKRREAIALTEELLRSTFLEMFGDPVTNPRGWPMARLGDLASRITKGTTPKTIGHTYDSNGSVFFLRAENLQNGPLQLDGDVLQISGTTHDVLSRSQIHPGDVLLSIAGTIGRAAIVPNDMEDQINCNQAVAIIRPATVDPTYLFLWLQTDAALRQVKQAKVTATISNLSLGQIKELVLPFPSPEAVESLHTFYEHHQRLAISTIRAASEADTLFHSLVQRAFRGEL